MLGHPSVQMAEFYNNMAVASVKRAREGNGLGSGDFVDKRCRKDHLRATTACRAQIGGDTKEMLLPV